VEAVKPLRVVGPICLIVGAASLLAGLLLGASINPTRRPGRPESAAVTEPALAGTPTPTAITTPIPTAAATPTAAPSIRSFAGLEAEVENLLQEAGADGGVSLFEIGRGQSWSYNGDQSFVAASTYKLPLLMEEAQRIVSGAAGADDTLCYDPGDWEDGYFTDYAPGQCYSRSDLMERVGHYSDNTAAHILVRYEGGGDVLNAYAHDHGATESEFWDPNVTTSSDLARLWQNEAAGRAGGAAAQKLLYPLLTDTIYEDGIPAGVPAGTAVAHKIGELDSEFNDAGLVERGPRGAYVLTVCTEGGSWSLIASITRAVAQFEAA
jgi:beta-lactamase class A